METAASAPSTAVSLKASHHFNWLAGETAEELETPLLVADRKVERTVVAFLCVRESVFIMVPLS